jgi:glycosyltransferase involved in cell wall biosynthesis
VARILQVCNTDFYLVKFLAPLVNQLARNGHEVDVACEGDRIPETVLDPGIRVLPFSFPRGANPWQFARAIGRMRKLVRAGHYECVNGHNRNASIVARVAAWQERVPVNLYTAHGFYFHDDQGKAGRAATIALEAMLARITHHTLSQSTEDANFMTALGHIPADRIDVIGNGIDTRRFHPRPSERQALETSLNLAKRRFRIASTGRLVSGKGFGDLLDAFARASIPESELVIIGGNIAQDISPYHAQFMERARQLDISDKVVITGLTDRVEDYLNACDIFVLPSYREGLPRALLEAMASQLPVIATNIRGCREAVIHDNCGLLFEPHDVESLSRHLQTLANAPELRTSLGKRARERVLSAFDEQDYVSRQVLAIEKLVHVRQASTPI